MAHVRQPNTPEYRSNFSVFGRSFDVLSGIWSEFDEICFLLKGSAHVLGHALLLGHIRYPQFREWSENGQCHADDTFKFSTSTRSSFGFIIYL